MPKGDARFKAVYDHARDKAERDYYGGPFLPTKPHMTGSDSYRANFDAVFRRRNAKQADGSKDR
jgi:hypothetical protein